MITVQSSLFRKKKEKRPFYSKAKTTKINASFYIFTFFFNLDTLVQKIENFRTYMEVGGTTMGSSVKVIKTRETDPFP